MGETIKIRTGKVWLDDESGVVRVWHAPGTTVTLADAKEQIETVAKVSGGKRLPLLVDMRNLKSTEFSAREYFGSPESRSTWRATALLTGSALSNAVGNIWFAVHDHRDAPSKLFSSETDAIQWLRGFLG